MEPEIMKEMSVNQREQWFKYKDNQFLASIDTFYYSVKLDHDFTSKTKDKTALYVRAYFERKLDAMDHSENAVMLNLPKMNSLLFCPVTFSRFYNVCLRREGDFDIFIAVKTPPAGDGSEGSLTPEIVVQIRSYMLWMLGVVKAFERTYEYVQAICKKFALKIDFVHENRCDYCWHNNYLKNPEKYFSIENFYKMRVDRYRDAGFHTAKQGSEEYEVDYIRVGRRGSKCFIRIYLKSKEVVEEGYKCWFFKIWQLNGMISRFDFYVYEQAYLRKSWKYLDIARLNFYVEHGKDPVFVKQCRDAVVKYETTGTVTDSMRSLADRLTPKVTLVLNVEFQSMRKQSKSFPLVKFRDNSCYGPAEDIYHYFDNRSIIMDYLTSGIFRLVKTDEQSKDKNKSRREDNAFWSALRRAKCVDVHVDKHQVSFIRKYKSKMNIQMMKNQFIQKAVMLGMYRKGKNQDAPLKDAFDSLVLLNDNDLKNASNYKKKKSLGFNWDQSEGKLQDTNFALMNLDTGEIVSDSSYDTSFSADNQEVFRKDEKDDVVK